jgi:hypothetical protein
MRLRQQLLVFLRADFQHQIILDDAAAHPPVDHEGEPAEHSLFDDVRAIGQHCSNTGGEAFIERHDPSSPLENLAEMSVRRYYPPSVDAGLSPPCRPRPSFSARIDKR